MTIYVNGYNKQFQNFVDFASQKVEAGKGQSIARLDGATGNLGGHAITAAKKDGVGGLSAFFRSSAKKHSTTRRVKVSRMRSSTCSAAQARFPIPCWMR